MSARAEKPRALRVAGAARALALAAVLLILAPRSAAAHLGLKSSTPGKGAALLAAPREIRLRFSLAVELAIARVRLIGPSGTPVPISSLRQPIDSGEVVLADITGALESGAYRIEWQVIGKDGHPVRGTIAFTIAPGATGLVGVARAQASAARDTSVTAIVPMTDTMPASHHDPVTMPSGDGFGAGSVGYVVVRWLLFTTLLITLGALAFSFVVLSRLARTETDPAGVIAMRRRAAGVGLYAAAGLVVAVLLRLYAQSVAMHGGDEPLVAGTMLPMLTRTLWGWGWILQAVAAVAALVAFQMARRERAGGWALAAVAGAVLAVTPALSGHAAAAPRLSGLAVVADTLHVIGAASWLGSLFFVLVVGVPLAMRQTEEHRGPAVARLVNAFSPTALLFAGLVAGTGLIAAWLHVGLTSALWQSDYGRRLLIKLAIVSIVIGTGAYNWLKVKPALGNALGTTRIRRSATVEVAVAVLVLAVTAVLVATPPPMESLP